MKKRWIIPVVVMAVSMVMMAVGPAGEQPIMVDVALLAPSAVEETVCCDGIVEAGDITRVSLPLSFVMDEMLVEVGQAVKTGDALFRVNKEATKALQQTGSRLDGALALSSVPSVVTAPVDGVVLTADEVIGNAVQKDFPCVVLAQQHGVQVRVMIREKHLPTVAVGQCVRINGAGFDKDVYTGRLCEIASTASVNATGGERMVEGVVRLDDGQADYSLRLGLNAKVAVVVNTVERGLVIPHEAVKQTEAGVRYVYLLRDGRAVKTAVSVVSELADGILVSTGSLTGERVILQPELVTADGASVQEATA